MIITRKEYMNDSKALHWSYYKQFVNPSIIHLVRSRIGEEKILNSKDPYFNDIPLRLWDALHPSCLQLMNRKIALKAAPISANSFSWSLSDSICTLKAAARIIKEGK